MKVLEIFENKLRYKNYSKNTIKVYKQTLHQYLKEIDCKDPYRISTKEIVSYLELKTFSSISQQNQFIGCLKVFARYVLNKKDIHLDKIERPRKEKKLPKVIDKEFLLDRISKINNLKHKSIITLAYSTGMRVSEVCNLKINDIDSKRMLIHIKNSKGNKDRLVPLSPTVLNLLREYFKKFKPTEYLFNGQFNLQYSHRSCNEIVKKYLGGEFHFHQLRHSNATALLESGTDIKIIQNHLGHSSSKTTEIYCHVSTVLLKNMPLPI
jgi:site-specific recombinase XerD